MRPVCVCVFARVCKAADKGPFSIHEYLTEWTVYGAHPGVVPSLGSGVTEDAVIRFGREENLALKNQVHLLPNKPPLPLLHRALATTSYALTSNLKNESKDCIHSIQKPHGNLHAQQYTLSSAVLLSFD
jgi:hypothetical protein